MPGVQLINGPQFEVVKHRFQVAAVETVRAVLDVFPRQERVQRLADIFPLHGLPCPDLARFDGHLAAVLLREYFGGSDWMYLRMTPAALIAPAAVPLESSSKSPI